MESVDGIEHGAALYISGSACPEKSEGMSSRAKEASELHRGEFDEVTIALIKC